MSCPVTGRPVEACQVNRRRIAAAQAEAEERDIMRRMFGVESVQDLIAQRQATITRAATPLEILRSGRSYVAEPARVRSEPILVYSESP